MRIKRNCMNEKFVELEKFEKQNDDIKYRLEDLEKEVFNREPKKEDSSCSLWPSVYDSLLRSCLHRSSLLDRVKELEEKVELLEKYLEVEKKTIPEETKYMSTKVKKSTAKKEV